MIDADFCKSFRGGWCPKFKSHIPRSWCFARCDIKKVYPGITTMAKEFAKETAKHIKAGAPKRSDEEVNRIKAICEACDELNPQSKRCYLCGCKMDRKIPWATAHCRIEKW